MNLYAVLLYVVPVIVALAALVTGVVCARFYARDLRGELD